MKISDKAVIQRTGDERIVDDHTERRDEEDEHAEKARTREAQGGQKVPDFHVCAVPYFFCLLHASILSVS